MKKILIGIFAGFVLLNSSLSFAETFDCGVIAPDSCFIKIPNTTKQRYIGNNTGYEHCLNRGKNINLENEVLEFLKIKNEQSFDNPVDVIELQNFLKEDPYTKELVQNNSYCSEESFADGKYGICTKAVFDKYLEKKCEEDQKNPEITISGTVTNQIDIPLKDVEITITQVPREPFIIKTDTYGKYSQKIELGKINIDYSKNGYESEQKEETVTESMSNLNFNIKLKPTPIKAGPEQKLIKGMIINTNGDSITGIKITIQRKHDGDQFTKFTFSKSNFPFNSEALENGSYKYIFTFTDPQKKYLTEEKTAFLTKDKNYDFGKIVMYQKCEKNSFDSDCLFPAWASNSDKKSKRQEIRGIYGKNKDLQNDKEEFVNDKVALSIVPNIINIILKFISPIVVVMFIFAGIKFIYAGSDEEDITSAKDFFIYASIGLAFIIMSYTLMKVVYFFLK